MSKEILGYIYKIIYPNKKIYIGSDHCKSLDPNNKNNKDLIKRYHNQISYLGSSSNILLHEDLKYWRPIDIEKEILIPLQLWESTKTLLLKENQLIKIFKSKQPDIGYNL